MFTAAQKKSDIDLSTIINIPIRVRSYTAKKDLQFCTGYSKWNRPFLNRVQLAFSQMNKNAGTINRNTVTECNKM